MLMRAMAKSNGRTNRAQRVPVLNLVSQRVRQTVYAAAGRLWSVLNQRIAARPATVCVGRGGWQGGGKQRAMMSVFARRNAGELSIC